MSIVFADRGLHLGVLGALLDDGAIDAAEIKGIVESTGPDGPEDGYPGPGPRLAASLNLLHAFTLPAAEVSQIRYLDFDGGNEIYMLVERTLDIDTGGESDDYNVAALDGILHLSSLRSLDLDGHGSSSGPLDLTPLTGHPTLTKLFLTGDCTAAETLETLPALRELDISLARLDDPGAVSRLESRGVTIDHGRRR